MIVMGGDKLLALNETEFKDWRSQFVTSSFDWNLSQITTSDLRSQNATTFLRCQNGTLNKIGD